MRFKWKQWVNIKQPLLHCQPPPRSRATATLTGPSARTKEVKSRGRPPRCSFFLCCYFVILSIEIRGCCHRYSVATTFLLLLCPSFDTFRQLQSALFEKREPLLDSRSCCLYCCTICKYCTIALESYLALTYVFVDGDAYDTTTQGGYISSRRRKTVKC